MGTSHEILQDRIDIANMQIEYLMSVISEEIPLDYLEEIELELQRIEEEYYKYEEEIKLCIHKEI